MPVDEAKLRDVLRHQGMFRDKFNKEIGTYQHMQRNFQFENGVLTYLVDASSGEMRDLIKDVGISSDNLEFLNVGDL